MKCHSSPPGDEPPRRYARGAVAFFAVVLHAAAACAPKTSPPPDDPNAGKGDELLDASGTLAFARGDWPVELQADPEWQSAVRGEAWALLRLGDRRAQLRTRVEAGGPAAEIALRAWPHARFAWAERGVLCRTLPRYVAADWGAILLALRESASSADEFGEVLDPEAAFVCERTFELLDHQAAAMSASVFDEYAATCQAFGRSPRVKAP